VEKTGPGSPGLELAASKQAAWTFELGFARPNPSSGRVTFGYTLARSVTAVLRLYNVAGRLVRIVVQDTQEAGPHEATWDGKNDGGAQAPAGVYFYRLQAGDWSSERKLVVIQP
jgi:flagellar hook assembly protein FlgD